MKLLKWALALSTMTALGVGCSDSVDPTAGRDRDAAHVPISAIVGTTAGGATLTTDRDDYQPGQALNLVGAGWPANDVVSIHLDETPQGHAPVDWAVTADQNGNFTDASYVVQQSDLGATFTITATSGATGEAATASFTDSPPAAFTTTNSAVDGAGHCLNGNGVDPVNCNLYEAKTFVWLNGGPENAALPNGTYFFAVLDPGGQNNAVNDAASPVPGDANLSDNHDFYANRTFTVAGGAVSYSGSHDFANNKIRLMPYEDTPNPGGVYILAICDLKDGYPVDPSNCKYDAFKIKVAGDDDATLKIVKTLNTEWTRTYTWTLKKSADQSSVSLAPGATATVNYTVAVTHDQGTDAFKASGTVTVTNTGLTTAHNVSISDPNAPSLTCDQTLPLVDLAPGGTINCTFSETPSSSADITNKATVAWDKVGGGQVSAFDEVTKSFTKVDVDACATVTDDYAGSGFPHTVCVDTDPNPTTFRYSRTVGPYNSISCGTKPSLDNTAAITAPASSVASKSVSVPVSVTGCAQLHVKKFYDANANGLFDGTDQYLTGWKVNLKQTSVFDEPFTATDGLTQLNLGINSIPFGGYDVKEYSSLTGTWYRTTSSPVAVTLGLNDDKTAEFGNVCTAGGGGLTLGFWSNNNGQNIMKSTDNFVSVLAFLSGLNLRNANGSDFNPATYALFRTWILGATATNMANMLSAQLAAMELNVRYSKVSGTALIYAPGTTSANSLGFATVNAVMAEANTSLGLNGSTVALDAVRKYQENLKNALDNANNNRNFVQAQPCPFSF